LSHIYIRLAKHKNVAENLTHFQRIFYEINLQHGMAKKKCHDLFSDFFLADSTMIPGALFMLFMATI